MTTPPGERIALVTGVNDPEGLGFGIAMPLLRDCFSSTRLECFAPSSEGAGHEPNFSGVEKLT